MLWACLWGKAFSKKLSADLKRAVSEGVCINSCGEKAVENAHMIVAGKAFLLLP